HDDGGAAELRGAREDVGDAVHRAIGAEAAVAALDNDEVRGGSDARVAVRGLPVAGGGAGPRSRARDVRSVADGVHHRAGARIDGCGTALVAVAEHVGADPSGRWARRGGLVPRAVDARLAVVVPALRMVEVEAGVIDADDHALPREPEEPVA